MCIVCGLCVHCVCIVCACVCVCVCVVCVCASKLKYSLILVLSVHCVWFVCALCVHCVCMCVCVCLLCEIIIRKSAGLGGRLSVTHGQQPSIHAVLTQRHQSHWGHLLVTMYFKTTSLQLC